MLINESLDYTIQIEGFEGPLDLLLRLIERQELDITSVALAQVADTYLSTVRAMTAPDPAALSAFLLIAAKLLLIKSRAMLPRTPSPTASDQPDEAQQLIQQLQEYQRYKQAASLLRTWEEQGRRSYTRLASPPVVVIASEQVQLDVQIVDLISAVQRRMQLMLPLELPTVPIPAPKLLTVAQVAQRIRERLEQQAWFSFEDLLMVTVERVEVVVTLWAVLELLKRHAIVAEQQELFGPIQIGRGAQLTTIDLQSLDDPLEDASGE